LTKKETRQLPLPPALAAGAATVAGAVPTARTRLPFLQVRMAPAAALAAAGPCGCSSGPWLTMPPISAAGSCLVIFAICAW
jgi:hypothetical protein